MFNCDSNKLIGFLTGFNNFRKEIRNNLLLDKQAEYKGNRKDAVKPKYFRQIEEYLQTQYGFITCETIEADDAISICANNFRQKKIDYIIVSTDKDLKQISGKHYNPTKVEHYKITQEMADDFLLYQMIVGDTADNIKGLPKKGPAAFAKYMQDFLENSTMTNFEAYILDRYIDELGVVSGIESFYYNYKMLRLLTEPEYGFEIPEIVVFESDFVEEGVNESGQV